MVIDERYEDLLKKAKEHLEASGMMTEATLNEMPEFVPVEHPHYFEMQMLLATLASNLENNVAIANCLESLVKSHRRD